MSFRFEHAKLNDVTVIAMLRNGYDLEAIVGKLAEEKELYAQRIMELEIISPRRIVMPDGKVMIYRCPDSLVPLTRV